MIPEDILASIFGQGEIPFLRPLIALAEIRPVKKNEILFREGSVPEELFFVVDGIYRGFFENSNGKDITDCFCCNLGEAIVGSIPIGGKALITMEAIQAGHVLAVPSAPVVDKLESDASLVRIYNRMLLDSLRSHVEIKKVLYQFDAMQKYKWFLQKYPGLDRKTTVRCIASYLDITPVTLSRVRSELAGELEIKSGESAAQPPRRGKRGHSVRLPEEE